MKGEEWLGARRGGVLDGERSGELGRGAVVVGRCSAEAGVDDGRSRRARARVARHGLGMVGLGRGTNGRGSAGA
jgi:hypothetical protein